MEILVLLFTVTLALGTWGLYRLCVSLEKSS
jgi:hypothetical protein